MLLPEDEWAIWEQVHQKSPVGPYWCLGCNEDWPCRISRLLATLRAYKAKRDATG